ncbi:acyl-CoA thioesterase FadM [Taibaiella chishuiensis]|uniref:Acyl-CoA thioesterase FadM n=2 Tax=Taibaiella chishuiensis TaxID=1434707 RepID=A0A2P8D9Z3_9BACT|nr:acyl-CoA thioesterase FadM [Taibaiella chishuiensis]
MARVKLIFPSKNPIFSTEIPLRITDMNYGNHLGNDAVLSLMHDARMRFLASHNHTELEIGGCGLIMADVMIAYKGQGYYGDLLKIELFCTEISSRSFDLMYKITAIRNNTYIDIADAKTGMVAFDYTSNKVTLIPAAFLQLIDPPAPPSGAAS